MGVGSQQGHLLGCVELSWSDNLHFQDANGPGSVIVDTRSGEDRVAVRADGEDVVLVTAYSFGDDVEAIERSVWHLSLRQQ